MKLITPPRVGTVGTDQMKKINKKYLKCVDEAPIQVQPSRLPPLDDEEGEDFGEFRDLFIQGRALNAEQMEAMDLNLLELSLKQQRTESQEEEPELKRLESFSPELEKLNEQNFKINKVA